MTFARNRETLFTGILSIVNTAGANSVPQRWTAFPEGRGRRFLPEAKSRRGSAIRSRGHLQACWVSNEPLQGCESRHSNVANYGRLTYRSLVYSSFRQPNAKARKTMDGSRNGAAAAAAGPPWDKAFVRVLWSPGDLDKRVGELANAISEDFAGESLVAVGVATGAFVFLADLVRKIKVPVAVDLIRVQSYGSKTESSGVASLTTDIRIDVKGRHVLLVEDIIDTGITLSALVAHFATKGVASLSVCTLLDKLARRKIPLQLVAGGRYYRGFECPDEFVVGYGMDYAEDYRNLPFVGILEPDVYAQQTQLDK